MENNTKKAESNKVAESKKRAVTISITAEQIKELGENEALRNSIIEQMNASEGGLKGNMAFAIAKAVLKQTKIEI